ncbi:MAG: methyltransferase [Methyloceanibacter sp.]|nr:methyltransferase [Methyloceanibacter sp.]
MISSATIGPNGPDEPDTTADAFLGGRIEVLQHKKGHRGGSDAVFLAAAVPACEGESALDAGAGAGTAGLCLLARVASIDVTAVEIDKSQCVLARKNAERNSFGDRFRVVEADVTAPGKTLGTAGLVREGYDQVMANPPFYGAGSVRVAPDVARASAHVMPEGELERWVRFLTTMAGPRATVTLIHRAEYLGPLLDVLKDRFGALAVYPLFPKRGVPASRVIIQGRKNSRAQTRLLPGLVLHEEGGAYTAEAEAVLRNGAALTLEPSSA